MKDKMISLLKKNAHKYSNGTININANYRLEIYKSTLNSGMFIVELYYKTNLSDNYAGVHFVYLSEEEMNSIIPTELRGVGETEIEKVLDNLLQLEN